MVEGHRRTDEPRSMNARASAAKTGSGARSVQRTEESRSGLGLRRSGRPRPARYERTSRNVFERHMAALSGTGQVDYCGTPTSLGSPLITGSGATDASDLEPSRSRYDDPPSGRCLAAHAKSEPCCAIAGLSPGSPRQLVAYEARKSWKPSAMNLDVLTRAAGS